MGVLEIVSIVYILFVILWAFKLVSESLDKELLTYYQQRSVKKDIGLEHAVVNNATKIEELEKELKLWWDKTLTLESSGIEMSPEHRAEYTRINNELHVLLHRKITSNLKQYRKDPRP